MARKALLFRVVTESGVGTPPGAPLNYIADPVTRGGWMCCGGPTVPTAREAVAGAAAYLGIIEIRGPGEATTAELVAAAKGCV